ncbi:MAG: energy transducer TonB [Bacteroidales bacterium]|nr:energy transducer TonB [Bacteroidales bacterium]
MKGKAICSYLKSVRREIAEANGIDLKIPECTHQGPCSGTCPQCESEVRLLERKLAERQSLRQKIAVVGVAAGISFAGTPALMAQSDEPISPLTIETTDSTEYFDAEAVGRLPIPAHFPGGIDQLYEYLQNNIVYPKQAKEQGITGTVVVGFCISKEGNVVDIHIIQGVHPLLDEEAMRVVGAMPRWEPALSSGAPISNNFDIPITFTLEDQKSEEEKSKE